jgi:hypothetical protein
MFKGFKNIYFNHGKFFNIPNKFWEFQVFFSPSFSPSFDFVARLNSPESFFWIEFYLLDLIEFNVSLTRRRDHAGFNLSFNIFGLSLDCQVYDYRHWDDKKEDWVKTPLDQLFEKLD